MLPNSLSQFRDSFAAVSSLPENFPNDPDHDQMKNIVEINVSLSIRLLSAVYSDFFFVIHFSLKLTVIVIGLRLY